MNNGLAIGIIVAVVAVALIGGWWLWMNGLTPSAGQYSYVPPSSGQPVGQGTVVLSVTDAAVNMSNISAVDMTVDKASLHSQTAGWVTLTDAPQTFSLLALKASGKNQLAARIDVPAGAYDQVWLHVSKVMVTESGKAAAAATLPSGDVKFNATVKVQDSSTTSAKMDVLADWSLHKTGKGEFIFAPVVNFESRSNASISMDANNMVSISGGTVDTSLSAGMDVNGEVKDNFKLDTNADLQINNGTIQLNGSGQSSAGLGIF